VSSGQGRLIGLNRRFLQLRQRIRRHITDKVPLRRLRRLALRDMPSATASRYETVGLQLCRQCDRLIVVTAHHKIDALVADEIDETVFLSDAA
jgi:hypothetical protein